jgi:hypothetical protein
MARWFKSPFTRAVFPIVGGIVFFAALFGVTWLMATYVTNKTEVTTASGDRTFVVGQVADIAESIAENGPMHVLSPRFKKLIRLPTAKGAHSLLNS